MVNTTKPSPCPGILSGGRNPTNGSATNCPVTGSTDSISQVITLCVRIVKLQKTNDSFNLEWVTFPPHVYQLQYTTNLVPVQWINVGGPITPTNYITSVSDAVETDPLRFYRNILQP
jgi:hypothetical protein